MNKYLSAKLTVLSFLMMIGVVMAHACPYDLHFSNESDNWSLFIQHYISGGICRMIPGLFFVISGYLFFYNFNSWKDFGPKMYKRVRTLLLPYLLWSAYGILFLALLQLLPQSRPFFNKTPISHYTLFQLLDTLFFHPVPYQFWFLRDLIFMVVLSPLLYPAVRILGLPWLAACLILWGWSPTVPFFISEDLQSPFFFCLGIWLALKAREEMTGVQWGARHGLWLFGGWLLVLAVKTTLDLDPGVSVSIRDVLYELSILLGVPACWSLYDVCYLRWKKRRVRAWLLRLYGVGIFSYSFFIYAFHEPVLTLLRKVLNILSGERGSVSPLPVFFLAPLLTIGLALVVAYGIKKAGLSGLYAAITGDR